MPKDDDLEMLKRRKLLELQRRMLRETQKPEEPPPPPKEPKTDEVFILIEGEMGIEFRDGRVNLSSGEMFVVPKGVEHRPVAAQECHVLLVEPRGVVNTGGTGGEMTADNDIWI